MKLQFYKCSHCKNVIAFAHNSGVPVICCGEKMQEIVSNSTEASLEKHIPTVQIKGNLVHVEIGEETHPMVKEHYIEWIVLETKNGLQYKKLNPDDEPKANFYISSNDNVLCAMAYCNIHGLWAKEIK